MKSKLKLVAAIALGGLMVCGPIAQAQAQTTPPTPGNSATPPAPRSNRGATAWQNMMDKLNLTDEQKAKVNPVGADMQEKMRALRQDTSLSQEDRRAKAKAIMDDTDAKLKGILTPDQYTKLQELRQQARNRGRRPGGTGNSGSAAPSTPKADSNQ